MWLVENDSGRLPLLAANAKPAHVGLDVVGSFLRAGVEGVQKVSVGRFDQGRDVHAGIVRVLWVNVLAARVSPELILLSGRFVKTSFRTSAPSAQRNSHQRGHSRSDCTTHSRPISQHRNFLS